MLEILEWRHDWMSFPMTVELMKYVFTNLIPDVIFHSAGQDEEQVTDHYDRGNDFHEWCVSNQLSLTFPLSRCPFPSVPRPLADCLSVSRFAPSLTHRFLGPRMIYTSGVITDINKKETLEELQDNKLALVCHKLQLKPEDTLLDIGCGWGTLVTYAAKNFGCDATGVTLSKEQAQFGTKRIADNSVDASRARILRHDFRDLPKDRKFSKIVSLEMAEVRFRFPLPLFFLSLFLSPTNRC
jgi:cyclopropane fatty-acyl-phospholipid synthase-like methyltransferase